MGPPASAVLSAEPILKSWPITLAAASSAPNAPAKPKSQMTMRAGGTTKAAYNRIRLITLKKTLPRSTCARRAL